MEIKEQVNQLNDELISLRRDLHRYPELGFEEYRTSKVIAKYLLQCGLEVQQIAKTGVVGLLRGKKLGRTVLLRADMDALPIQEQTGVDYKSLNEGKMHACGHDGHVAMLLIAAKILVQYKDDISGNVKFLFQPNEEDAGAQITIDEGVLENPQVDAAFAIHLWAPIESGIIGLVSGPIMAAHDNFRLTITGKGGHTSAPQSSIDPIITAANIIQTAQTIQTREIDVLKPTQIMFGKINGGTASNIIPENVHLEGTLRYLYAGGESSEENPKKRFDRLIKGICEAHRAEYTLEFIPSNSPLINDSGAAAIVRCAAEKVLGDAGDIVSYVCMAGDDFSEIAAAVPSTFYFVGTGNKKKKTNFPHHHPCFNIDEDTLAIGVEMHVRTALMYLNK